MMSHWPGGLGTYTRPEPEPGPDDPYDPYQKTAVRHANQVAASNNRTATIPKANIALRIACVLS